MEWANFPNVAVVDGIVLVGEAHGYQESRRLVERVVEYYEPQVIGLESTPLRMKLIEKGGMSAAKLWAEQNGYPCATLDARTRTLTAALPPGISFSEYLEVANAPQSAVEGSGRMPFSAIFEARRRVCQEFGERAFRVLYEFRESQMARRLKALQSQFEPPVVAVVGAFHVPWIADELQNRQGGYIEDKRIKVPVKNESITHGFGSHSV